MYEWLVESDLEGSGFGIFEILGDTKGNHKPFKKEAHTPPPRDLNQTLPECEIKLCPYEEYFRYVHEILSV
jgi:hypothetical protein